MLTGTPSSPVSAPPGTSQAPVSVPQARAHASPPRWLSAACLVACQGLWHAQVPTAATASVRESPPHPLPSPHVPSVDTASPGASLLGVERLLLLNVSLSQGSVFKMFLLPPSVMAAPNALHPTACFATCCREWEVGAAGGRNGEGAADIRVRCEGKPAASPGCVGAAPPSWGHARERPAAPGAWLASAAPGRSPRAPPWVPSRALGPQGHTHERSPTGAGSLRRRQGQGEKRQGHSAGKRRHLSRRILECSCRRQRREVWKKPASRPGRARSHCRPQSDT